MLIKRSTIKKPIKNSEFRTSGHLHLELHRAIIIYIAIAGLTGNLQIRRLTIRLFKGTFEIVIYKELGIVDFWKICLCAIAVEGK